MPRRSALPVPRMSDAGKGKRTLHCDGAYSGAAQRCACSIGFVILVMVVWLKKKPRVPRETDFARRDPNSIAGLYFLSRVRKNFRPQKKKAPASRRGPLAFPGRIYFFAACAFGGSRGSGRQLGLAPVKR